MTTLGSDGWGALALPEAIDGAPVQRVLVVVAAADGAPEAFRGTELALKAGGGILHVPFAQQGPQTDANLLGQFLDTGRINSKY